MLIGDGVSPGNEARGYVLRRLLRRAVRSMRLLGVDEPVLPELLPVSRDAMAPSYPELARDFGRISPAGVRRGGDVPADAAGRDDDPGHRGARDQGQGRHHAVRGERAFQLHDTYGFPIDLTLEMAAEQGVAGRRGRASAG